MGDALAPTPNVLPLRPKEEAADPMVVDDSDWDSDSDKESSASVHHAPYEDASGTTVAISNTPSELNHSPHVDFSEDPAPTEPDPTEIDQSGVAVETTSAARYARQWNDAYGLLIDRKPFKRLVLEILAAAIAERRVEWEGADQDLKSAVGAAETNSEHDAESEESSDFEDSAASPSEEESAADWPWPRERQKIFFFNPKTGKSGMEEYEEMERAKVWIHPRRPAEGDGQDEDEDEDEGDSEEDDDDPKVRIFSRAPVEEVKGDEGDVENDAGGRQPSKDNLVGDLADPAGTEDEDVDMDDGERNTEDDVDIQIDVDAVTALQEEAEAYIIRIMRAANDLAMHMEIDHVQADHIACVQRIGRLLDGSDPV